jgi:hypothetical protein
MQFGYVLPVIVREHPALHQGILQKFQAERNVVAISAVILFSPFDLQSALGFVPV